MAYKKGDFVYYFAKAGDIPCVVKKVGSAHSKNKDSVLIEGESPDGGSINSWVHISSVTPQDQPRPRREKQKKPLDNLREWLQSEIDRCEKEIDEGGSFYVLDAEKDTYEVVIDKTYDLGEEP